MAAQDTFFPKQSKAKKKEKCPFGHEKVLVIKCLYIVMANVRHLSEKKTPINETIFSSSKILRICPEVLNADYIEWILKRPLEKKNAHKFRLVAM